MITGKISLYKEPRKWKGYQHESTWEDQLEFSQRKPNESELTELLALSELIGFKVGARVKRASGWGETGTIVSIYSTLSMAWSYTKRQLEPMLVRWDPPTSSPNYNNAFPYHPDELNIVKQDSPALLTLIENHIE